MTVYILIGIFDLIHSFGLIFLIRFVKSAAIFEHIDLHLQRTVVQVHVVPLGDLVVLEHFTESHLN